MRTIIFSLWILSCCTSESEMKCGESFIDSITKDLSGNSKFIVMDVFVDGNVKRICINNHSLHWRLKKRLNLDGESYSDFVKKIINHQDTLHFTSEEIGHNYFVEENNEIKEVYSKGLDSLKAKYFENGVQRDIPINNKNYLASILFANCIASWIDDTSGFLMIEEG